MIGDWFYPRSVTADVIRTGVTRCAISSPMPRAVERAVTRGFSIPIGSAIAAVWSYEFSKSGNLLSPLL
jgi:hypothetical protein